MTLFWCLFLALVAALLLASFFFLLFLVMVAWLWQSRYLA